MKTLYFRMTFIFLSLTIFPSMSIAEESNRIQELEKKIQERDKVILELLERVENLEQRLGVKNLTYKSREKSANMPEQIEGKDKTPEGSSEGTPGAIIVDEDAAERALMRSLTREGGLLLPKAVLEIEPGVSYARKEAFTPSLFISDDQVSAGQTVRNANSYTADLEMRLGLPWDSQLEIGLPYRWGEVETVDEIGFVPINITNQSGDRLGDLRIGLAKTLFREKLWQPNLVGRITWDSKTGKISDDGLYLGGGYNEFRGSLTAIKRQDPVAFIGGLSYKYSLKEEQFKPGQIISANFGSLIALSPETSIRFLISGAYQNESELSGNEIIGSDRTIASFVVGGSTLLMPRTLLNLSVAIGLTEDADDFSISLSLPLRLNKHLF